MVAEGMTWFKKGLVEYTCVSFVPSAVFSAARTSSTGLTTVVTNKDVLNTATLRFSLLFVVIKELISCSFFFWLMRSFLDNTKIYHSLYQKYCLYGSENIWFFNNDGKII